MGHTQISSRSWVGRGALVLVLALGSVLTLGVGTAYAAPPDAFSTSDTAATGVPLDVFLSADDPDGDPLTYAIVSGPSHGALTGDCTTGTCTYTSAAVR